MAVSKEWAAEPLADPNWQIINSSTRRQAVPGGWLYQVASQLGETVANDVRRQYAHSWHPPVFVPDASSPYGEPRFVPPDVAIEREQ